MPPRKHPNPKPQPLGSQVQNVRHLPPAIVGTVLISMLTYLLLSLSLVLLVYPNIACPACNIVGSSTPPLVNFISAFNNGHGARLAGLEVLFGGPDGVEGGSRGADRQSMHFSG